MVVTNITLTNKTGEFTFPPSMVHVAGPLSGSDGLPITAIRWSKSGPVLRSKPRPRGAS
ncbi:hypothetical protein J6590_080331 [Homalodisca vitripennis]|nr:hypothetical protein J6590_080331 [Homalodisca vitripennis]